jgi:hypothetical protein
MDASDRIKTLPSILQGGGRPHMATYWGRQEKCAFLTKPPMPAHHIAVVENTHDPVTYMATFLETFSKKSRIFRLLE